MYVSYDSVNKTLQVYKNPFNFVNDIEGSSALKYDENNMSNDEFFDLLLNILKEKSIKYSNVDSIIQNYKALEDKFDEFKTRFYKLQGWDTTSGYPTRDTLKSLDLSYVAEELEKHGKLGKA